MIKNRRTLINMVGLTPLFWEVLSCAALANDAARTIARIAYIGAGSALNPSRGLLTLKKRLHELGWIQGRNLVLEEGWAQGDSAQLLQLMSAAVERRVDIIVTGSSRGALAAKKVTSPFQ
jgi:hypothetical protein